MKIEMKEIDQLTRELSVEVPVDRVNGEMENKFKSIRRDITLKGFRKGKAPMDMIKKMYRDQVKAELAEDLIKATYPEVVREKELKVASYPTVTHLDFADDGSFKYTAKVEIFPVIERVTYDKLVIHDRAIEVTDHEVDEVIEHLRKSHSETREVNREVLESDVVTVDIKVLEDKSNVLPKDSFSDSEVDLANKMTVTEFKNALPGMKVGDTKDLEVRYDKDYPDNAFAGSTLKYRVTIRGVKERILPATNDAFAKQTGQAETLLELRMKIRDQITSHKKEEVERAQRSELVAQLTEHNPVPIPNAMIDEYLDKVVEDFKKQYEDINEEELRKNYHPVGANTIRWNLLLHHLARQENIEVLPSDTENLISRFAENYKTTPEQAKEALQRSGNVADIRESILEDKVVDFLKSKAQVTKTEPAK